MQICTVPEVFLVAIHNATVSGQLTGAMRGSKRSSWGAPGFLKLPESLKTESEAAFTAILSTFEAGSCAVAALSSRRRSAEYSPAATQKARIEIVLHVKRLWVVFHLSDGCQAFVEAQHRRMSAVQEHLSEAMHANAAYLVQISG